MVAGLLDDRSELESLFRELADELEHRKQRAEIVMVGGSWLLWHTQRSSTRDVDSARRFEEDLSASIQRVAQRRGLKESWLNDSAAAFWPTGARYEDCEVVFRRPSLVVRSPAPEIVFVMKLYRADPQDREDLILLWPLCDFADAEEAADRFRLAYPHAPDDEHLTDYIAEVAIDSTGNTPA